MEGSGCFNSGAGHLVLICGSVFGSEMFRVARREINICYIKYSPVLLCVLSDSLQK